MNLEDAAQALDMDRERREGRNPLQQPQLFAAADFAELRSKALTRFALDFLKANLGELEADGLLDGFGPVPTEDEIEALKQDLGVKFS